MEEELMYKDSDTLYMPVLAVCMLLAWEEVV